MEGFPPSSAEDDVVINWTSNVFDLQSLEDIFNIPEPLSYVILKHILSKDDSLQFSYSSVFSIIPKKTIMPPPPKKKKKAGRHRRFQTTKAPYYAMIKVDRTM